MPPKSGTPASLTLPLAQVGEGSSRRPEQPWIWAKESKQEHQGARRTDGQ